jgi:Uri superfamily endonuclease
MSRFGAGKATSPHLKRMGPDHWRMSWTVDYYYKNSMLRWPRRFSRDTDDAGAKRFAKKHGIVLDAGAKDASEAKGTG